MKPTFTVTVGSLKPTARPPMQAASATSSKPDVPLAASSVIQVEQKGKRFVVQPASGVSLLDAAPWQGIPLDHKCKKERAAAVLSPSLPALTFSPRKHGASAKKRINQRNGWLAKHG